MKRVEEIQTEEERSLKHTDRERERERAERESVCVSRRRSNTIKGFCFTFEKREREREISSPERVFLSSTERRHVCADKQQERHGCSIVGVLDENQRKRRHQLQTRTLEKTVSQE